MPDGSDSLRQIFTRVKDDFFRFLLKNAVVSLTNHFFCNKSDLLSIRAALCQANHNQIIKMNDNDLAE